MVQRETRALDEGSNRAQGEVNSRRDLGANILGSAGPFPRPKMVSVSEHETGGTRVKLYCVASARPRQFRWQNPRPKKVTQCRVFWPFRVPLYRRSVCFFFALLAPLPGRDLPAASAALGEAGLPS